MITSPQNEKLKLLRRLDRRRTREREGLFACEGEDLVAAGIGAGHRPAFVLVRAGESLPALGGISVDEVEPELLDRAGSLGSGVRAVAAFPLPAGRELPERCVYLDGVSDPGNVGSIVRSTDALLEGWGVVAGPGTADPWGPRAVRASMGAIFAVRVVRAGPEAIREPALGLAHNGGSELGDALEGRSFASVCLGAERTGLAPETLARCDVLATIRHRPGAVESLNVAAAAAIALYRISSAAPAGVVPGEGP